MPEINGLEVLLWVNSHKITIPVILQTGIEDKLEIKKATKLGIKNYLIKPYTKEDLYQFITKYAKRTKKTPNNAFSTIPKPNITK